MKKFLAITMLVALAGCGSKNNGTNGIPDTGTNPNWKEGWNQQVIQTTINQCVPLVRLKHPEVSDDTLKGLCSCTTNLLATQYSYVDVSNNNIDASVQQQDATTCGTQYGISMN